MLNAEGMETSDRCRESYVGADLIFGNVRATFPEHWGTAYTAEMEVYCILRGASTPSILNVTHAGYVPGMCTATDLLVGNTYIVPLMDGYDYQATGVAIGKPEDIAQALQACRFNLAPVYPIGASASNSGVQCPAGLPPGECLEH